jgi:lipopolysaccharide transport system ATP-binding protein
MQPIIEAHGLGKQYSLVRSANGDHPATTLREALMAAVAAPHKIWSRPAPSAFWALEDISFQVQPGEVVGIVGRNGSGKSTLLKILSRITRPTTGHARLHGRVSSLLEVGSGFHPDLTGRQNVFLNGAILGMRRREIERRFDEIVAFAEIDRFIDTPVKRYSSGMYMRLAFAVAAHLEAEIVLVDEVLAVGDAGFQQKCLQKVQSLAQGGQTVLLVSHNADTVAFLCGHALLLNEGRMTAWGEASEVLSRYEEQWRSALSDPSALFPITAPAHGLVLQNVTANVRHEVLSTANGNHQKQAAAHLEMEARISTAQWEPEIGIGIMVHTLRSGKAITHLPPAITGFVLPAGEGERVCRFECRHLEKYLAAGDYSISLRLHLRDAHDALRADHVAAFDVPAFNPYATGHCLSSREHGLIPLPFTFTA